MSAAALIGSPSGVSSCAVNEVRRPFQESCTPGYFNADGRPEDKRSAIGSGIFFPSTQFFDQWAKMREAGDFGELTVS
jgi:cyclohexanone monooxygenase